MVITFSEGVVSGTQDLLLEITENAAFPVYIEMTQTSINVLVCSDLIQSSNPTKHCPGLIMGEEYCIEYTDDEGCETELCFTVEGQTCPDILDVNLVSLIPDCDGQQSGGIVVEIPESGCDSYTISWDNGMTGTAISNLSSGIYCASVQGSGWCEDCLTVACFDIEEVISTPIVIEAEIDPVKLCNDVVRQVVWLFPGSITLDISGGTGNYTIDWLDSNEESETISVNHWGEDAYCVVVTDECGNMVQECFDVGVIWLNNSMCSGGHHLFTGDDEEFLFQPFEVILNELDNLQEEYYDGSYWTLRRVYFDHPKEFALMSPKSDFIHLYLQFNGFVGEQVAHFPSKGVELHKNLGEPQITIEALPNPFRNVVNILLNSSTENSGILEIRDLNGKVIGKEELGLLIGENQFELHSFDGLNAGIYIISYTNENDRITIPVVKVE